MMAGLARGIVLLAGLYLLSLGAVALAAPSRAARFLLGFARTAPLHYGELALRGIVGVAFVVQAPHLRLGGAFTAAGWMLRLTTAGLALVPWRRHRAFAERAVPLAARHLSLLGASSLVLGALVWAAAFSR